MWYDVFKSRGFWTMVVAVTPPVLFLVGVTDDKVVAAISTIVGAVAAFFGVTLTRVLTGKPRSYADAERRRL